MKTVRMDPGVCGFVTEVQAESQDGQNVRLKVVSGCEHIRKLAEALAGELDGYAVCFSKCGQGLVYEAAREAHFHAACPVPAGIVKAIEAECSLALPKDVEFRFI